jgi:hypothetical protein
MEHNIFSIKLVKYFVYIIQDIQIEDPIIYQIGDHTIQLNYKPIYVGRGCGNRHMSHVKESHNPRVNQFIKENPNHYLIEKVIIDLPWTNSVMLEQGLIYTIGRLDLGTGPLFNDTAGVHWNEDNIHKEPGPLNLELNKLIFMLNRLNKLSNKRIVAESLGVSERTLYRMMKGYNIQKERISPGKYEYFQI